MTWAKGQWNIICDVCGWEFPSSQILKRWDGLLVDRRCFETDHPQKYLRVQSDPRPVPPDWIRIEPELLFVDGCTYSGTRGVAGYGIAGCAISGREY